MALVAHAKLAAASRQKCYPMQQCFCFAKQHVSCQGGSKLDPTICSVQNGVWDCGQQQAGEQREQPKRGQQAQKVMIGVRADLPQEKHAEGVHSLQYLRYLAQLLIETHDCFHLIPVHHRIVFILLNILCAVCMFGCQGCHKLLPPLSNYKTLANASSVSGLQGSHAAQQLRRCSAGEISMYTAMGMSGTST